MPVGGYWITKFDTFHGISIGRFVSVANANFESVDLHRQTSFSHRIACTCTLSECLVGMRKQLMFAIQWKNACWIYHSAVDATDNLRASIAAFHIFNESLILNCIEPRNEYTMITSRSLFRRHGSSLSLFWYRSSGAYHEVFAIILLFMEDSISMRNKPWLCRCL